MLSYGILNSSKLIKYLEPSRTNFILVISLFFVFTIVVQPTFAQESPSTHLDSTAIDMLVGTPQKIQDPLNPQKIAEPKKEINVDLSNYLEDWELEDSLEKIGWNDAETDNKNVNINIESQYLDLIAEMDIQEETQVSEKSIPNFETNSANSVETEN